MKKVEIITKRPEDVRSVPILAEHEAGHYPEFTAFFTQQFGLAKDPFGPPGLLRVEDRHYELVFIGRSGRPFPSAIEVNALVPGLEPLDEDVADRDLFAILSWMVDGIGGDWSSEALATTGRIYRISSVDPAPAK